jgi:hypothetical protein
MTATLPESRVTDYRRDGFLFPMRAMNAEQAAAYRAKLEKFEADYPDLGPGILRSKSHLVLSWVNEIIRLDPVLDVVESILGPNIFCWGSSFFIKNPHHPGFVAWHQDAPFSSIPEGGEMLTAWIALAPSIPENGCLKVVAGTHTEQAPHTFVEGTDNLLSQGQEIAVEVDEADATSMVLEPGQFSLHHQFIFHGSDPSHSDERRIGIAVRYMAPFKQEGEPTDYATLVRGEDPYDTFIQEPVPAFDMDPAAVAYRDNQLRAKHGDRYATTM